MRRKLRRWKRKGREGKRYRKERKKHKDTCDEKKREGTGRWEKGVKNARTKKQILKVINRKRKQKKRKGMRKSRWRKVEQKF